MKNKSKLRKGDNIIVTAGKDKGKNGKIEKILAQESRVLVPNVNLYKRHRKPQGEGKPGEILTLARSLPVGSVSLVCPKCKQPTRIGWRWDQTKKVRVCRKCEADIDQ